MTERRCDPAALERLRGLGGDALARRIVDSFLTTAPERIGALVGGSRQGDLPLVERVAHSLKSSAANVGAGELVALADELELRAAQGPSARIDELVARIEPVFEAVRDELVVELDVGDDPA